MESLADINTLLPEHESVTIKVGGQDKTYDITPFHFKQFKQVSKYLGLIRAKASPDGDLDLVSLVAEHGDAIGDIIAVAIRETPGSMDELDLVDVLKLAVAVIKVNRDFFSQRLLPIMGQLTQQLSLGAK
jgi:hypothetical protein